MQYASIHFCHVYICAVFLFKGAVCTFWWHLVASALQIATINLTSLLSKANDNL